MPVTPQAGPRLASSRYRVANIIATQKLGGPMKTASIKEVRDKLSHHLKTAEKET